MGEDMNAIVTKHRLDFEACDWSPIPGFPPSQNFKRFRIGTCEGLWQATDTSYDILAVTNDVKGNGHFEDVLEWFEYACKRDHKHFRFLEVMNARLLLHLIDKRGFARSSGKDVIKKLKWMK